MLRREAAMELDPVNEDVTEAEVRSERGASLVEYALLLALIAVVCVGSLQYFGSANGSGLNRSSSCIGAAVVGESLPTNC